MSSEPSQRLVLSEVPIPEALPHVPEGLLERAIQSLSGVTDAVFRPWIEDRITLIWLENEHKRMGVHAFILKQYGMKTNRDWTRIDSQGAAACEFLGTFFEPSHAQPLVFIF